MQENQGLPFAPLAPSTGAPAPRQHREDENRVHIAIPVKVYPDTKSVESHTCCTYEISMKGARLVAPPGIRQVGQEIWVQRQNRRARYKVAWIGQAGTMQASQVGVETLEPSNIIWESEIRARLLGR